MILSLSYVYGEIEFTPFAITIEKVFFYLFVDKKEIRRLDRTQV